MANYMQSVCGILGVELNEVFELDTPYDYLYKLTLDGLIFKPIGFEWADSGVLISILLGKYNIIKLPQFTSDDVEIANTIPIKYKWIARDNRKGILHLFRERPSKVDLHELWISRIYDKTSFEVYKENFKSIKFSDSEPVYIDDIIKNSSK